MNMRDLPRQTNDPNKDSLNRGSFHTLQILDEVAGGKPVTQRDLSKKLGIALGMTNNYIKRLAKAGYIEINRGRHKQLHYLLTPKGIAERTSLTYQYLRRSYQVFTDIRKRVTDSFNEMEKEGVKNVVLYRATVVSEIAVLALLDTNIHLLAIVDDDLAGQRFLGQKIEPLNALRNLPFDRVVITTGEPLEATCIKLEKYGIDRNRILPIG